MLPRFAIYKEQKTIWETSFPAKAPKNNLNLDTLSKLHVSGSHIKNITQKAAYAAAAEGTSISMTNLKTAVQSEYQKIDKPFTPIEQEGWDMDS